MIASQVELMARRRLVAAFIKANPVTAAFTRAGVKVQTAGGGYTRGTPTELEPQTFAIVPAKRRYDNGIINAEAGDIKESQWLLLGSHTLNVAVDDEFTWLDQHYYVTAVHPTRRGSGVESILCSIDYRGESNG